MPVGSLLAFACGETSHGLHRILHGAPRDRRVFPAGAFLYTAGDRRVLFDTGYAPEPWRAGIAGWAYRRMLPPLISVGDPIGEQLDPADVTDVVISHLHPDHIGGLRFFPGARFVLSGGTQRTLDASHLRDGVLRRLLPPWFETAEVRIVDDFAAGPWGLRTVDLFGDGAYLIVDLPGHSRGHIGALIEERVLIAGDAAWGRDLLGQEHRIRLLPRAVAHDHLAQRRTAAMLLEVERAGVRLLFSHDPQPTGSDLLRSGTETEE